MSDHVRSLEDLPPVLTQADIAEFLRIGRTHAARLPIKRLPGIGRSVRYLREDFIAYLRDPRRRSA